MKLNPMMADYIAFLTEVKGRVQTARLQAGRAVNRHQGAALQALKVDILQSLNKDERKSWEYLSTKSAVTRQEFENNMGYDSRKAQRHLKRFIELGLLQKVGASSATKYEVRNP